MREVTKRPKDQNPQEEEPKAGSLAWFRQQSEKNQQKKPLRRDIDRQRQGIPHRDRRSWI